MSKTSRAERLDHVDLHMQQCVVDWSRKHGQDAVARNFASDPRWSEIKSLMADLLGDLAEEESEDLPDVAFIDEEDEET